MEYLVVIERGPSSFGAYVPDLPGCVAVGETRQEVEALIREAIEFHLDGLREEGQPCRNRPLLASWSTSMPNMRWSRRAKRLTLVWRAAHRWR